METCKARFIFPSNNPHWPESTGRKQEMKKLVTLFLTMLAFFAAAVEYASQRIVRFVERRDPLDNLGLALSPVRFYWHKHTATICTALALVCLSVLPAHAMPVWGNSGAISHWIGGGALAGWSSLAGAQAQQQRAPFRYGTMRRRINIGSFAVTPGTQIPAITIPQVGMLARVLVDIEGSYTVATAPLVVANLDGFDALFARAQVSLNNGSAQVVDVSGVGFRAINSNISTALPIKKGTPAAAGNVNGTQMPLAIGASTFSYKGFLPVNANQKRQFEMGLLNLQAPEFRATINLSFNPLSQLFTVPANCTLFTATCNIAYEYYEIPDLARYQMPPLTLVRTIEEAPIAIAATGAQTYQFPRLGTMIEYHCGTVLNLLYPAGGALSVLSEFDIKYNKTDQQYQVFAGDWETYEAEQYGYGIDVLSAPTPSAATPASRRVMDLPFLTFNLWSAGSEQINGGDFRDAIDTEENTTTEAIVTVKAGTALNAGKDNLFHVRRVVQRVVPSPINN
jgi:hypothetical protein